jgi:ribonucleoside-diphosphate reductase alpha chain
VYLQNVDHANTHSPFKEEIAPIKMSNLCCEIDLPTVPLNDVNDEDGRIALCTLSAINWGNVKGPHDFEKMCRLAVRGLDALLSYQNYPVRAAELATQEFRPLGVGIINFAYFLAKNDVSYSDPKALPLVDEYAEAWSYYLIKASADLAKEQGPCTRWQDLKYADGRLPIDTYKKEVDELVPHQERMPWAELRGQIQEHGIRNSTLMALMPAETSAQISNATNGIEPPRSHVSVKQSKHGVLKQVVPEFRRLKNKYELLWDQ